MEKISVDLSNNGTGEFNDSVFHRIFPLEAEYTISIRPSPDTAFWRFGFALSEDEAFLFRPNTGRYVDSSLRFLEVNVGERNNGIWEFPSRLQISSYHIDAANPVRYRYEHYESGSVVLCRLRKISPSEVGLSVLIEGQEEEVVFTVGHRRVFRVFSWADFRTFALHAEIGVTSSTDPRSAASEYEATAERYTWALLLNTDTWDIASFSRGMKLCNMAGGMNALVPTGRLLRR
jgi:hypothetical protein